MNAQQAEEFVRLIADMQTSEENAAAGNCDVLGIFDDLIVTARQILPAADAPAPHAPAQQSELMAVEWSAWRNIARLWKEHDPNMNAPKNDQLVLAIRGWGEELVALRLTQTPKVRADARIMYATERRS